MSKDIFKILIKTINTSVQINSGDTIGTFVVEYDNNTVSNVLDNVIGLVNKSTDLLISISTSGEPIHINKSLITSITVVNLYNPINVIRQADFWK